MGTGQKVIISKKLNCIIINAPSTPHCQANHPYLTQHGLEELRSLPNLLAMCPYTLSPAVESYPWLGIFYTAWWRCDSIMNIEHELIEVAVYKLFYNYDITLTKVTLSHAVHKW